jgi:hypothetical protein
MMLNDVNSFIFLRSKTGYKILEKYKLGGGNHLSLIGQFAILNFISKIHFVLNNGTKAYVGSCEVEKITKLKKGTALNVRKYVRIPRLGEINEKRAFVLLIFKYPKDIGIPKVQNKIEKVWDDLRNKMSHLATIEADNSAVTLIYPTIEYSQIFEEAKKWTPAKPFIIIDPTDREKYKAKIKKEDPAFKEPLSKIMWNAASNVVTVDFLNIAIQEISAWVIENINKDSYSDDNLSETEKWIKINFRTAS